MENQLNFFNNLLFQFKKELIDRYVTKVIQKEISINRPGKDDSWYKDFIIYTNSTEYPLKITFAQDRGFTIFESLPEQEVEKSLLLTEPNYVENDRWLLKLANAVKDFKLHRKIEHTLAFLTEHEKLERLIRSSRRIQNQIVEHLSSNNNENLEFYADLKVIKAGATTNGSSRYYPGWDIYMEFESVYFGDSEFIDENKLDFSTYKNYQNIIERISAVNQGFEAYKRFKAKIPLADIYGLKCKS